MYKEKDIIKFNNLKLPKTKYLKGKYISGLNYKSGNMYLTFDKDILSIGIENNDGIFYDKINDIKEIKINIKPYNYIKMVQSDYEPNLSKTNGRITGSVEHRNKVTVLKSYELISPAYVLCNSSLDNFSCLLVSVSSSIFKSPFM